MSISTVGAGGRGELANLRDLRHSRRIHGRLFCAADPPEAAPGRFQPHHRPDPQYLLLLLAYKHPLAPHPVLLYIHSL